MFNLNEGNKILGVRGNSGNYEEVVYIVTR